MVTYVSKKIQETSKNSKKAPDQNRTDTNSLEGYCSTIELQARKRVKFNIDDRFFQVD